MYVRTNVCTSIFLSSSTGLDLTFQQFCLIGGRTANSRLSFLSLLSIVFIARANQGLYTQNQEFVQCPLANITQFLLGCEEAVRQ